MTLKLTPPTDEQRLCLSAAVIGLIGGAALVLKKLPDGGIKEAFGMVASGTASFVWTVEAREGIADIKLELVHLDGDRITLSVHSLSLDPPKAGPSAYEGRLH